MKPINKDELYAHLSSFLKGKGVELKAGSYSQGIEKSCGLLTDAINLSQKGIGKAKVVLDQRLDQMRQIIHEQTAPKPTTGAAPAQSAGGNKGPVRKPAPKQPPVRAAKKPRRS
jgi:hypothetical protein